MMTVGELREQLDDYGDNVEVVIEVEERGFAVNRHVDDVGYRSGLVVLDIGDRHEDGDA